MKIITIAKQILYEIDLLKTPFSLYLDGKPKNSTFLGSLISIIIFYLLYYSFYQSNMIQKTNPYLFDKITRNKMSPTIKFEKDFQFVFSVVDFFRKSYLDKSIFSIEAKVLVQNGSKVSNHLLNAQLCSKKDFEEKDLNEFNPINTLCLEKNDISISGMYDEDYFNSLQFSLRLCNNETDGMICRSQNEIINFLKDKYLIILYPEYIFDLENYEQPYVITKRLAVLPILINSKSLYEINLKKIFFTDDDNWIFKQEIKDKNEIFATNYENKKFNDIINVMDYNTISNPIAIISIQSSKDLQIISRKYQKLQEVLANLSGLANSFIFIGLIITKFISHLNSISLINNALSNFNDKTKQILKKLIKENNKNLSQFENIELKSIKLITVNSQKEEQRLKIDNIDKEELNNQIHKYNKIKTFIDIFPNFIKFQISFFKLKFLQISIFEYFKSKLKLIFSRTKNKNDYVLKAEMFYKEKIDIIFILRKLQELEYLKMIVLSPTQNSLFNFLINRNSSENNDLQNLLYDDNHLNNYRKLLNKEKKNLIDINFLELLNKSIETYESLAKKST